MKMHVKDFCIFYGGYRLPEGLGPGPASQEGPGSSPIWAHMGPGHARIRPATVYKQPFKGPLMDPANSRQRLRKNVWALQLSARHGNIQGELGMVPGCRHRNGSNFCNGSTLCNGSNICNGSKS